MPLIVNLENQLACYSGHEQLWGRVVFHCPNPIEAQDVRVIFTGRVKAKVQKVKAAAPSATYRSKCILFEQVKTLSSVSGGKLQRGTYEWPFEFVFPSHVESSAKWPPKHPFRSDGDHSLPPTFAVEVDDSQRKVHCAIDYRIEAQISKPQKSLLGKKAPLFSEAIRLNFLPLSAQMEETDNWENLYQRQQEEVFTVKSLLLLPENRGRSLKTQEKFRSWLAPKQLPRFDFRASFIYCNRVVQGSPVPCWLDVTPLMDGASSFPYPGIMLQSVSLVVLCQTAARANKALMGQMDAEVDERMEVLSKTSLGMPVLGQIDLNEAFGPLIFRNSDVSFSTFNICRSYRICASFVFECVGKTLEFNVADLAFEMVANALERNVISPMEQGTTYNQVFEMADATSRRSSSSESYEVEPPSYPSKTAVYELPAAGLEKAK
ncbi:uncharacterized protein BDW43DRAFT_199493 [Aspergillus alliaceus]|uniref:uncharacterized protein n=1 Tax=Petromyces alliaceus TaxID=209559 RepID=UPI0012A4E981|nr:uncharacterized protein BDW43DRAFT_199493 [Aspergillus alliaceus]KAB8228938.1 hypothetical protein BDW43DRAFT_199493 [Aspergillus alliaceus]